jgi:urea carboxylase-associated protein 2
MTPLLTHDVPSGSAYSVLVRTGRDIRLTALEDGANCSTLLFAAHDRLDRLNVPDTLKAQMSACIRPPMVLMSDRGIGLASVTGSSLDWHDAITGHSLDAHADRFGPSSYGGDGNGWRRSARHGLLSELRKHGLGPLDLHGCVNFFSKVATSDSDAGTLAWVPEHARAGDWVTLRAELDLLVVLSTAPHPLEPSWHSGAVRVDIEAGQPYEDDDASMTFRPESARALLAAKAVFV